MTISKISANDWVILALPNEHTKIVFLKAGQFVDLSKYGKFLADELFGQMYNICYEISKEGKLTPFVPIEDDQGGLETSSADADVQIQHSEAQLTNQTIFDSNTSQKLSHFEILELRDSGKSVVAELVQNSLTFEQKNSFSKVKYIQRKQRKFSRWMRVVKINSRTLCNHFIAREPQRIFDLRLDSLSQLLNVANVQFGGKFLLMDDTRGVVLGAVMERCLPSSGIPDSGPRTQILVVHEDQQFQPHLLETFNFNPDQLDCLYDIHLSDCMEPEIKAVEWVRDETDPERLAKYADRIELRRIKFVEKQDRRMRARQIFDEGDFTSIVLVVEPGIYTAESLVSTWAPYLQCGGIMVLYSSSKEALNPAFFEALGSTGFTDVRITESFLRPYQTAEGRMHPMMTCNGHGGFILSMIKVAE